MLPRFHHILVPLSLTARNNAAIDIAFDLTVHNKAAISLLHVVQVIESNTDPPDDQILQQSLHSSRVECQTGTSSRIH